MISNEKLSYFASNFWNKVKSKFALKDDVYTKIEVDTRENESLSKLKELAITLTGQENVQGETVADVLGFINSNYSGGGSSGVSFDNLNFSLTRPSNIGSLGVDTWEINRIIQSGINLTYYLLTNCLIRGKFSDATLDSEGKIEVASHSKYMKGTLPCIYQMSNDKYKSHNGALEFMGGPSGTSIYFSPDGDLPSGNIRFYIMINGVVEGDLSYEQ